MLRERENTVADFNYQHEAPLWEFSTGIFLDLDDVTGGIDDIADPDEHIDFGASGVGLWTLQRVSTVCWETTYVIN